MPPATNAKTTSHFSESSLLVAASLMLYLHTAGALRATGIQTTSLLRWQARRESNPQPADLESAALPIELLAFHFFSAPPGGKKQCFSRDDEAEQPKKAVRPIRQAAIKPPYYLVEDLGDDAGSHRSATLTDRKT